MEDLYQERLKVWGLLPHLTHHVKRIYVDPSAPLSELLVVAAYKINRKDCSEISQDTAAHFSLTTEGGAIKIQMIEIYAVPLPATPFACAEEIDRKSWCVGRKPLNGSHSQAIGSGEGVSSETQIDIVEKSIPYI